MVVFFYLRGHLSDSQFFIFVRHQAKCFCFCVFVSESVFEAILYITLMFTDERDLCVRWSFWEVYLKTKMYKDLI